LYDEPVMDAFDHLIEEHRLIVRVLGAFENYIALVADGSAPPRSDLERFVGFLCDFVDLGHHDKEETVLIPALVRRGLAWDDDDLSTIRRDHDVERYLFQTLRHAALRDGDWSAEDRRRFSAVARELVQFLRAHAEREERLLFAPGRRRLSDAEVLRLGRELERVDAERGGQAELRMLGEELIRAYERPGG
jgi:hemerythrin-like domain-containing protein